MKVIIVKKWKEYNVDDVVEVTNGFGTNFLIKNGYALPFNKNTSYSLEKNIKEKQEMYEEKRKNALSLKEKLEKEKLLFFLKTTNLVIHGSVTTKQVNKALLEKGYKLEKHSIPHVAIASLGSTKIPIKLFENIFANVEIEVRSEK